MSQELQVVPRSHRPKLKHTMSLDMLWAAFVKMRGELAPTTRLEYDLTGARFCRFMQERQFTAQTMYDWVVHLAEQKLHATTTNKINCKIKGFLRFLKIMGYVAEDLAVILQFVPQPSPKPPSVLTEEEYDRFKAHYCGKNSRQAYLWLVILGYRTGMSLVDCCHLRWRDVHLDDNGPSYIDIYRIKTARQGGKALCRIPIIPGSDLHVWLLNFRQHQGYKLNDSHNGIRDYVHKDTPSMYACRWWRLPNAIIHRFKEVGIYGRSFKSLRSTFVSNLVNSDVNVALICKMTGHSGVGTLLRYLNPDRQALQNGLNKAFQYAAGQRPSSSTHNGITESSTNGTAVTVRTTIGDSPSWPAT